jgi:colanic acid biosynthesis glycosyl transferase WcaI
MAQTKHHHLWVLSELYYPESSATGYTVTKIVELLASSYDVFALCAQPTYQERGTRAPADETWNNVRIHRCAATTLDKDVLSYRLINLLTISISIFLNALWRMRRGDVALVVTNPPTLPFLALLACRIRGAKLILRLDDVYPEALVATDMLGAHSFAVRVMSALHRYLYKNVDAVIVLGRDMLHLVQSKIGSDARHVRFVPNFADHTQITPLERGNNPLLQKLGLIDKFVVQYSGNMGRTHDLESLVECARSLEAEGKIHFLFIGAGAKEPWLRRTTTDLGLTNVTILPPQPRADLATSLNACDIAVISFVNGMSGVSVPCRMYNNLAAGKPIFAVADKDSELGQMIEEGRVGWVVPPCSPALATKTLRAAASNPAMITEMSERARRIAVEKYSLPFVASEYGSIVESLGLQPNHGPERAS